jgi:4-amino-4-deoxy-L-arabinose transferase-like glycosyltransferase
MEQALRMYTATARNLTIVILCALALRLGIIAPLIAQPQRAYTPDSFGYVRLAHNLRTHQVFSFSEQWPFEPTALRTPVYPLFLMYLLLPGRSEAYALLAQALLGVITVALVYCYTARLSKNNRAAFVAGLFAACEPASVASSGYLLTEPVFTIICVCALICLIEGMRMRSKALSISSFALMGVASLCRPGFLYFPLALACTLFLFRKYFRVNSAVVVAGLLVYVLTLVPWYTRNYASFKEVVFTSIQDEALCAYAYNIESVRNNTPLAYEREKLYARCSAGMPLMLNEIQRMRYMVPCGMRYVQSHKRDFLRIYANSVVDIFLPRADTLSVLLGKSGSLTLKDIGRMWAYTEHPLTGGYLVAALVFLICFYVCACTGFAKIAQIDSRVAVIIALFIGYYVLHGGILFQERYRVPVTPWLALCAGFSCLPKACMPKGRCDD